MRIELEHLQQISIRFDRPFQNRSHPIKNVNMLSNRVHY